ncbi:UNC-50 family protein [Zea mays]|uniref:UNC-50 family protein n=1 Tax=Zea mays TaxID=4577 RepID=A0A1D6HZW1_MAIZE|nr:UNC-50 family protein [Zea mays]
MLPTTASKGRGASRSAPPLFGPYLRRIVKWQQMDIEYTFWQMVHLCTSPKVVYQHTKYHKRSMHLTFIVTRSFLRLSSYMWCSIFCRLYWSRMASFQLCYLIYSSWWQFLIITT